MSKLIPSFLYNMGRLFSYTIIGAVVGGLGAVINISPSTRGMGAILAGGFMLIMGLSMLDISFFRKIIPRMPKVFAGKLYAKLNKAAPFTVGLLNGLMPCGPLQSMQLFALGTGDALVGALSMFFFALGTVPLMFGLGALSSLLSHSFRGKMVKVGAVLVAVLGAFMLFMGISNAIR